MLDIIFYNTSTEDNRVDKSSELSEGFTISGILKSATNIVDPVIRIEYEGYPTWNYAYVGAFNRFYFVTNIVSTHNNIWEVEMHCDVLMTYRDAIKTMPIRLARSNASNFYSKYVADNSMKCLVAEQIELVDAFSVANIANNELDTNTRCFVVTTVNNKGDTYTGSVLGGDNDGSMVYLPSSPLRGINNFCRCWVCNANEIKNIATEVLNDNENVGSYVVSIVAYPIDIEKFLKDVWGSGGLVGGKMRLGEKDIVGEFTDDGKMAYLTSQSSGMLSFNTDTYHYVQQRFGDFRDYNPYTKIELYLPYYGTYELAPIYAYNGFKLNYIVDWASGSLSIVITAGGGNVGNKYYENLVEVLNTTIGQEIPVNSTNAAEIQRKKTELGVSATVSAIAGTATMIAGLALMATGVGAPAGAAMIAVGGASAAIGGTVKSTASMETLKESAKGSLASSNLSNYLSDTVRIVRRFINTANTPEKVSEIYGYPSDYIGTLENAPLGAYVQAEYVHVEGSSDISSLRHSLKPEREEIEHLLISGVKM